MTTQNCQKCGCPIQWDKLIDKTFTKKDGSTGHGWWREDLSKEEHTKERCQHAHTVHAWNNSQKVDSILNELEKKGSQKSEPIKVNWPTMPAQYTPDQTNLMDAEEIYCKMAYDVVRARHPGMDENSNTFGQIVSAVEGHLIQCGKILAIRELRSEKE